MENLIKDNKDKFMTELPAGHRERFAMKVQNREETPITSSKRRRIWFGITSAAAAVLLIFFVLNSKDAIQPYMYGENDKVVEMRMLYEAQLDESLLMLENVLENVDDSTRNKINKVIENLTSTAEVFAEIAPLPEEKQLAITSRIYDNQISTLKIICEKISKGENNHE